MAALQEVHLLCLAMLPDRSYMNTRYTGSASTPACDVGQAEYATRCPGSPLAPPLLRPVDALLPSPPSVPRRFGSWNCAPGSELPHATLKAPTAPRTRTSPRRQDMWGGL